MRLLYFVCERVCVIFSVNSILNVTLIEFKSDGSQAHLATIKVKHSGSKYAKRFHLNILPNAWNTRDYFTMRLSFAINNFFFRLKAMLTHFFASR